MSDTVSLIIAAYNAESCLRQTLDSIVAQTYDNLEIVIVVDGATDATLAIAEEYAAADSRFVVHSQENKGAAVSRNVGLDLATGDFVMLLDADDIYDPHMVELLFKRSYATDADVVVCRSVEFDNATGAETKTPWTIDIARIPPHDPFSPKEMYDYLFIAFVGWAWDKFYKRSFVEENKLRFVELHNSEDLYFAFLSLIYAQKISVLDDVLVRHRVNRGASLSNSREAYPEDFYLSICALKETLKEDPRYYEKLQWGFLNWALQYTLWNIETLPNKEKRDELFSKMIDGGYPELELSEHSADYFNLLDDFFPRMVHLSDGKIYSKEPIHPILLFPSTFLDTAAWYGCRSAFGVLFKWVDRKLSGAENPRELRGMSLPYAGKKDFLRVKSHYKENLQLK